MSTDEKNLSDLGDLWRSQAPVSGDSTREEIANRVRAEARRLDRTIFWRNLREVAAGALLICVMGWSSWLAPGWPPKVGALVGAVSVALVLGTLLRSRRAHPPVRQDLALVDRLQAELRKVEAEIRLLRSVRSWYLAPLFVGAAIWSGTLVWVGLTSAPIPRARLVVVLAACGAVTALVLWVAGWAVGKLNQAAVRARLEPYAQELNALLDEIRSGGEEDHK